MTENLIVGLVSGLVVTLFVVVFRSFWSAVIVPWFEERVYKDVKIEGKWFGLYPHQVVTQRQDVIVLKRHGHAITGKMICTQGPDEGEEYSLSGSFRNLLLPLIYETTDKTKTDRGSLTLMCSHNGERLDGKISAYNTHEDVVGSVSIIWFRSREELEKVASRIGKRVDEIEKLEEERKQIQKQEQEIEESEEDEEAEIVGGNHKE